MVALTKDQTRNIIDYILNHNSLERSSMVFFEDKVNSEAHYPYGELDSGNVIVRFYYGNRPGWSAIELNREGGVVNRWDGGLD